MKKSVFGVLNVIFCLCVINLHAATLTVTTSADNSGSGTLRSAIASANAGDTITFAANLSGASIVLTNGGGLILSNNVTIDATALAGGIQINGNGQYRVFTVNSEVTAIFNMLTITNGNGNGGGGIYNNDGSVILNQTIVTGNLASSVNSSGGGIYNNGGNVVLNQSTVSGNSAVNGSGSFGGGIFNYTGGSIILNESTVSGNVAGSGGGIFNFSGDNVVLNESTISSNTAILNGGVEGGGGVYNFSGNILATNSIVSGNIASTGADIYNKNTLTYGGTNLVQTVFNSGTINNPSAVISGAPNLAPLGNYGGPTATMPPLAGSPAIDAGSTAANIFTTDQRGLPRLSGAQVDIGAVELQQITVTTNADNGTGSLRSAIGDATNNISILFAPYLSGQTILLTSGQLTVSGLTNLTIDASALAGGIAVNGNQNGRIFYISGNAGVTVNNLTVTNGYVSGAQGGGIYIDNNCNLTLNDCLISGNTTADQDGGGILNNGNLTVNQSLIVGNLSGGYGGGGIRNNAGTAILNQSTLANNINNGSGGGGIHNAGSSVLTLNECTFSGNSTAGSGGGIFNNNSGTVTVNQSTFSGNTANSDGGGIWGIGSSLNIFNSVVAGNSGGGSVNISGSYTGSGVNVTSGTVNLAPLGNYGGLTPTMPPLVGATNIIDQGSDTAINLFTTDQRGLPRRSGAHVDIGAVEAQLAGQSPILVNEKLSSTGIGADEFQFGFTNSTGKDFTAYGSTNVTLPFTQWQYLGRPVETPAGSGEYHFFDLRTATNAQSFYRVTSP